MLQIHQRHEDSEKNQYRIDGKLLVAQFLPKPTVLKRAIDLEKQLFWDCDDPSLAVAIISL
jgi:hypothetical protein